RQGPLKDFSDDPFPQNPVFDWKGHFYTTEEIARHPIGTCHIDLRLVAVAKPINPAVLEKTVDNASNRNGLTEPRHTRPEAAYPADDEVDGDPCGRCLVKRLNNFSV